MEFSRQGSQSINDGKSDPHPPLICCGKSIATITSCALNSFGRSLSNNYWIYSIYYRIIMDICEFGIGFSEHFSTTSRQSSDIRPNNLLLRKKKHNRNSFDFHESLFCLGERERERVSLFLYRKRVNAHERDSERERTFIVIVLLRFGRRTQVFNGRYNKNKEKPDWKWDFETKTKTM